MIVSAKTQLDTSEVFRKTEGDELGLFAAHEFRRLCDDYVPMRTGQLAELNVRYSPWEIEYYAPYASAVYNRKKAVKFSTEFHKKACKYWDKAALRDGKGEILINSMQSWCDNNI